MSRVIVLADIHANLPALDAVLDDCGAYDSAWFLGDAVDLGPWPRECVSVVHDACAHSVVGNHDVLVLRSRATDAARHDSGSPPSSQSQQFARWRAISYAALREEELSFLAALPDRITVLEPGQKVLLLHHPYPHGYFHGTSTAQDVAAAFDQPVHHDLVLFGHSHVFVDREDSSVRYICAPSVGQPRDGDPRAGYLVIEDGIVSLHRVEYDIARTVHAIKRLPLDEWFIEKWVRSVITADLSDWHGNG